MLAEMRPSTLGLWFELYALDSRTGELVARMRPETTVDNRALSREMYAFFKSKITKRG